MPASHPCFVSDSATQWITSSPFLESLQPQARCTCFSLFPEHQSFRHTHDSPVPSPPSPSQSAGDILYLNSPCPLWCSLIAFPDYLLPITLPLFNLLCILLYNPCYFLCLPARVSVAQGRKFSSPLFIAIFLGHIADVPLMWLSGWDVQSRRQEVQCLRLWAWE